MCGLEYKDGGLYRNGKLVDLGMFNTIEEAQAAYLDAKPKE